MMKTFIHKNIDGFTLIETLIAVSILTLAVSGPLYSASRSLVAAQTASSQLIANYLAQEGVEFIRRMRDDEYLLAYQAGSSDVTGTAWTNFNTKINSCVGTNANCLLDPQLQTGVAADGTRALKPCSGSECDVTLYLTAGGQFQLANTVTKTPFSRTIRLETINASDKRITSTVSWTNHGVPYSVTVYDHITPWQ